jgi:hypothetical protein
MAGAMAVAVAVDLLELVMMSVSIVAKSAHLDPICRLEIHPELHGSEGTSCQKFIFLDSFRTIHFYPATFT